MGMRILQTLPEGAMDPKPGEVMDSKDIAIENYLKSRDDNTPQVFPDEGGKIDTPEN